MTYCGVGSFWNEVCRREELVFSVVRTGQGRHRTPPPRSVECSVDRVNAQPCCTALRRTCVVPLYLTQ